MTRPNFEHPEDLARALLTLYRCQTDQERLDGITVEDNSVGFNATDAPFLTSVAEWLIEGKPFTVKQQEAVRGKLPKYAKQLERLGWQDTPLPRGFSYHLGAAGGNGKVGETSASSSEPKPAGAAPTRLPTHEEIRRSGDGLLVLRGDELLFFPNIYPSTEAKGAGFRWDKPRRCWAAPARWSSYSVLLRTYPRITVEPYTRQAMEERRDSIANAEILQRFEESTKLFPFQLEAAQWLAARKRAMLSLAPGLGKTVVSLMAAKLATRERVLVVAPLSLLFNWRNEIRRWLGSEVTVEVWHRAVSEQVTAEFTVVNYDTLRKLDFEKLPQPLWDCVILDESILLKNRKAQRTQLVKQLASRIEYVWELTGSPTSRCYDDMWAQLNILDSRQFSSYWRFAERYCVVHNDGWGTKILRNQPDAAERIKEDLAELYYARTQDQVINLPPWIFQTLEIPMGERQWRTYVEMEKLFKAQLDELGEDVVLAPSVLAQITRLIQFASNPGLVGEGYADQAAKWQALEEILSWAPRPAIVWTNYIQTANRLAQQISDKGYSVAVLTGETPEEERGKIVERFQSGEIEVLFAHPGVGKFGLTLTAGRTAVYLERSYNADDYYQSLHRVRRIGTQESPLVLHVLATGPGGQPTIDHVIDAVLRERTEAATKLTSGMLRELLKRGSEREGYDSD